MSKLIISILMFSGIFLNENLTLNELDSFFYVPKIEIAEQNNFSEGILDKSKNKIDTLLNEIPRELKKGIKKIILYPQDNDNIAGVTNEGIIELYNFSKYSNTTQKYILYHEIAHTWGRYLMDNKILDYHYTDYQEFVKQDNNYVSKYSKDYIINKQNYSEDFADSIAQYLINRDKFIAKYSNRAEYILVLR